MICYKEKKIVIIGLGMTGVSCINFFLARKIKPRIMDTRINPPNINKLPKRLEYWLGSINQQWLLEATLIIISPSIKLDHKAILAAKLAGIEIISDIELFTRETKKPIIAITGSNGKSTVTKLISNIMIYAGWFVGIGGNIGIPVLTLLNKPYQLYILELSSFQLESTNNLNASIAVILNVQEDHMDHYPYGLKQYSATKLKIYNNARICIFNNDDKLTMPISKYNHYCISFGHKTGDYNLFNYEQHIWLMAQDKLIINCSELKLHGTHNYMNVLVALALSDTMGISRSSCITVIKQFHGLAHRFQLIYNHNGVQWINDSKATNISSTKEALNNVKNTGGVLHLLLGGDGKSADFSLLTNYLKNRQVKLYCFGKDGKKLTQLKPECSIFIHTLEQAMYVISKNVLPGDTVLLSPACSSLDQFDNFEDRGNIFTQLAQKIG